MNNALYVYDSTNNKNVRLTSSDSELNVNHIEKTLKQYRREGKCYFSTINGTTNITFNDLHMLWNPPTSNYKVGLYNVSLSISSSDTSGSAANFSLVSLSGADLNGDEVPARNVKLDEPNDAHVKTYKSKAVGDSLVTNGILDIVRFKPSGSSGQMFHKLDFQEEIVEIEPGNGIKYELSSNNTNMTFNYSASFRYIKLSNSEEI